MIKFSLKLTMIVTTIIVLSSCRVPVIGKSSPYQPGEVITLGLSEDGNTVISAGRNGGLLRWNVNKRSYIVLAKDVNPYSVYLVKGKREFIWQDDQNIIHLSDFSGKSLFNFKAPQKVYSGVLTNDNRYYFMSDILWNKYRYDTVDKKWIYIDQHAFASFLAAGKPLNMTLTRENKYLLTSGVCDEKFQNIPIGKPKALANLDCVVLWDVKRAKPIKKFWRPVSETYATINTNGRIVITGSDGGMSYIWYPFLKQEKKLEYLNKEITLKKPKDFVDSQGYNFMDSVFAYKYIAHDQNFRFTVGIPYVVLYGKNSIKPMQYIRLGKMPFPSVADYSRSGSIDTSIKTHTLVTGQASFDGINVYKFDPKTETLYRVWSPILNKPPTAPKSLSKDVPTLPGITFDQLSEVKHIDSYPKK